MRKDEIREGAIVKRVPREIAARGATHLYESVRHGWTISENARVSLSSLLVTNDEVLVGAYRIRGWEEPLYPDTKWTFHGEVHESYSQRIGERLEGVPSGKKVYVTPGFDFGTATERLRWLRSFGPNPPAEIVEELKGEWQRGQALRGAEAGEKTSSPEIYSPVLEALQDPYVSAAVTVAVGRVIDKARGALTKPYSEEDLKKVLRTCWLYLVHDVDVSIDNLELVSIDSTRRAATVEVSTADGSQRYQFIVSGRGRRMRVVDFVHHRSGELYDFPLA